MSKSDKNLVVCVAWEKRSEPSDKVSCVNCKAELAFSVDAAAFSLKNNCKPICIPCVKAVSAKYPDTWFGGVIVGEKAYTDLAEAEMQIGLYHSRN